MKAFTYHSYGLPSNLAMVDVPAPTPKSDEVKIRVVASSINSWDWDLLVGKPSIYRLLFGLFKPKYSIIGSDVSGIVEQVGKEVHTFKPGDEVYADTSPTGFGTFAEYVVTKANLVAHKPTNLSHAEAASVPQAGVLALQGLIKNGLTIKGQKVLINGAGGGVGGYGIQLAKLWGAHVTGVDKEEKFDFMQKMGADEVIDYQKENYTHVDTKYDLILDNVSTNSARSYKRVLTETGHVVIIGGRPWNILKAVLGGLFKKSPLGVLAHKPNTEDLAKLTNLFEDRKLQAVVHKIFDFDALPDAMSYYSQGIFQGKVVISND